MPPENTSPLVGPSTGQMMCLHQCPPWGLCATKVTPDQAICGICGSRNGVHGYDGYVKESTVAAAEQGQEHPLGGEHGR